MHGMTTMTVKRLMPAVPADVTSKIEDFITSIPGDVEGLVNTVKEEANNTAAFLQLAGSAVAGIAGNVTATLKNSTQAGAAAVALLQYLCLHGTTLY